MNAIDRITKLLVKCGTPTGVVPPTELYNEGWMLRLVLDWFASHSEKTQTLRFLPGSRWFSEAQLPSAFLPRTRPDDKAEGWTHADGVIGQFEIREGSRAEPRFTPNASQFVVTEAKLFSPLSAGTTHARWYDQAARNVACMAFVVSKAFEAADQLSSFGFYVIAPENQINSGLFEKELDKASIRAKVSRRVEVYRDSSEDYETRAVWLKNWCLPVIDRIEIGALSWESIVTFIGSADQSAGRDISAFYEKCLVFNEPSRIADS